VKSFVFSLITSFLFLLLSILFFYPIFFKTNFQSNNHIINNIVSNQNLFLKIKILFCFSNLISIYFLSKTFLKTFLKNNNPKQNIKPEFGLLIGKKYNDENIFIPEKSLYQNMLITGSIGCGKTSSAMYPFTQQLINYKASSYNDKLGFLILDVKGNYYKTVIEFAKKAHRENDVIVIELGGKYFYNPLNKPMLKASVLANRLKTILLLFSPNNSESYWLDIAEQVLESAINFCRIYNNGFVNFQVGFYKSDIVLYSWDNGNNGTWLFNILSLTKINRFGLPISYTLSPDGKNYLVLNNDESTNVKILYFAGQYVVCSKNDEIMLFNFENRDLLEDDKKWFQKSNNNIFIDSNSVKNTIREYPKVLNYKTALDFIPELNNVYIKLKNSSLKYSIIIIRKIGE
jgi:hypothetical protein